VRKTYISGPMRGHDLFNFPAFFECEKYIKEHLQREVINPAREDMEKAGFNPFFDEPTEAQVSNWLARDLDDISTVEEMVLLPGWLASKGAKKELAHYLRHRPSSRWRVWMYDPQAAKNYRLKGMTRAELDKYNVPLEDDEGNILTRMQKQLDEAEASWLVGLDPAKPQTVPEAYHRARGYIDGKKEAPQPQAREFFPEFPRTLITGAQGSTETRTTSSTGGQKGVKPERWDLIPWEELAEVARLYAYGATKYADRNWEKGYEWGKSFAALQRHILAWWDGEDNDPEHGLSHLTSVVFHALALMRFRQYPQFDDRPKPLEEIQNGVYQPRWADSPDAHPVL
jgi:hypothetical protein